MTAVSESEPCLHFSGKFTQTLISIEVPTRTGYNQTFYGEVLESSEPRDPLIIRQGFTHKNCQGAVTAATKGRNSLERLGPQHRKATGKVEYKLDLSPSQQTVDS
jgi:hypothetical protein